MAKLDYTEALKNFDDYISDNLEEVDLIEEGIKASFVSKFHFYRFFKAITGMTVNGYIVERRLTNVLHDLMGEKKIISIALDKSKYSKYYQVNPNFQIPKSKVILKFTI